MIPITREFHGSALPIIPDDVIHLLLSHFGPVQYLRYGWNRVSHGFSSVIDRRLAITHAFDFRSIECDEFDVACPSTSQYCLSFIISRLKNVRAATIPMSVLLRLVQSPDALQLPHLKCLKVLVTLADNRRISSSALSFRERKTGKETPLFLSIDHLHVEVEVNEECNICLADFREFISYAKQFTAVWYLTLLDRTKRGQGWCPPCEIYHNRELFFISYVRCFEALGVELKQLRLQQCNGELNQTLHLYHEYKKCCELFILYNVGFISGLEEETFPRLTSITIKEQQCSNLDLYLSTAPSLVKVEMLKEAAFPQL